MTDAKKQQMKSASIYTMGWVYELKVLYVRFLFSDIQNKLRILTVCVLVSLSARIPSSLL